MIFDIKLNARKEGYVFTFILKIQYGRRPPSWRWLQNQKWTPDLKSAVSKYPENIFYIILRLKSRFTCILAICAQKNVYFILETNALFLKHSGTYTLIFSASKNAWLLKFILCSTKIDHFLLPWQGHTLKLEATLWCEKHGILCLSRAGIPWHRAAYTLFIFLRDEISREDN